jgi:hypothetical protein
MPKVEVEANELTDAKVSFVSLVHRPANRLPFKMTKSEEKTHMIDLSKLFKFERPKPMVSALIVSKGADLEKAKARITAAGFSVEKSMEQGDVTLFVQGDKEHPLEDALIVKFDEDVAAACVNVDKSFQSLNFESTSFQEMMAQEGFWPSVWTAMDVFRYTVGNVMDTAKSADEAATTIGKACEDLRSYLTGLVGAVPMEAFKMESGKPAASPSVDGPAKEAGPETPAAPSTGDTSAETGTTTVKGDAEAGGTAAENPSGASAVAEGEGQKTTEKSDDTKTEEKSTETAPAAKDVGKTDETVVIEQVTKAVEGMLKTALEGVSAKLAEMSTSIDAKLKDVVAKADEAATLAKSAKETADNAVVVETGGDPKQTKPVKSENGHASWDGFEHIDTAYHRPK